MAPQAVTATATPPKQFPIRAKRQAQLQRNTQAFDRFKGKIERDEIIKYPVEVQTAMDAMTGKQRRFAQLVAAGHSQSQAYLAAYDVKPDVDQASLGVYASNLAANVKVASTIQLIQGWLDSKWLADEEVAINYCLATWHDLAENSKDEKVVLKATELIARRHAAFVQRVEVTHFNGDSDNAASLMAQSLADLGLSASIDADYEDVSLANQHVTTPSQGVVYCARCKGEVAAESAVAEPAPPEPDTP